MRSWVLMSPVSFKEDLSCLPWEATGELRERNQQPDSCCRKLTH